MRALMVEYFDLDSFDQLGVRPHRTTTISRAASVSLMMAISWDGAMLYRGYSPSGSVCSRLKASRIWDCGVWREKRPHMPVYWLLHNSKVRSLRLVCFLNAPV